MVRPPFRLLLPALLAAGVFGAGAPLSAQDDQPELQVTLSADGKTVFLAGPIGDGAFHRFDAVLRTAPNARRVLLSSPGGLTIEARLIAALVRKARLDTRVEAFCGSACTQIFAAGRERVIGPRGRLGFHQAALLDDSGLAGPVRPRSNRTITAATVFGLGGNDMLRLAYERAGVDPAFIARALGYGPGDMWVPEPAELIDARMATRLSER